MNPPSVNMKRTASDPAELVMITVLHKPETNLKSPAAICWIKKTRTKCLKNLWKDELLLICSGRKCKISMYIQFYLLEKVIIMAHLLASGAKPML
jgi:hypothetical protein